MPYNKVILMGNLTRDPELRVSPSGMSVCKIGLAINRKYRTQDGEQREEVVFVDCDSFGKTADNINRWMSKGKGILIEGRLKLDQWEDRQTGQQRSRLGVNVESFQFVGGRSDDEGAGYDDGGQQQPQQQAPRQTHQQSRPMPQQRSTQPRRPSPPPPQTNDFGEDDIPF